MQFFNPHPLSSVNPYSPCAPAAGLLQHRYLLLSVTSDTMRRFWFATPPSNVIGHSNDMTVHALMLDVNDGCDKYPERYPVHAYFAILLTRRL